MNSPATRNDRPPTSRGRSRSGSSGRASGRPLPKLKGPAAPRTICMKPRHQRLRWVMYSLMPSGARPSESALVQIDGLEAVPLQPQGQQIVLGHGSVGKPPTLASAAQADHRGRAAAERRAPGVLGRHHDVEEVALLVRPGVEAAQIGLDRIGIDEMLRRLHDADVLLAKQRERARRKCRRRHEIGVEDRDEVRRCSAARRRAAAHG